MGEALQVSIQPWARNNLPLLFQLNAPEMTKHLGGPETEEQVIRRHDRYLSIGDTGCMFSIVFESDQEAAGSVGYWERQWQGETVYEMGWGVLPHFQGKGIASEAVVQAIAHAASKEKCNYLHAFPSINNPASNAICQKLHFERISECEFEYPQGSFMKCNDWRFDLRKVLS
ncbi:GNAT family N-acetyltransferase [Metabacillus sp. RGM 3146]|uniref:GNAT family N-acetyltransferase n=1 Tax=Metabacillus sp. RGM 3146 TaxID=3401092 RepID=UPI003B9C7A65